MKKFSLSFAVILSFIAKSILAQTLSLAPYTSVSNFTAISLISPETFTNQYGDRYSGCWGWYQANKNKEYAIAGSASGTFWIDVTNPATPSVSAYKAGSQTDQVWREIKTYQNYCYVITDDPGANTFQIFDMQYLPDSVRKVYDSQALFKRGHTLWVDGNKLYVAGITYSNNSTSSMNVYSLATPSVPVLLRELKQDYPSISYVHDMLPSNDTVFASCGNQKLYVYKFNPNNTFTQIGSLSNYPASGFNHSTQLTPNRKTLIMTDEVPASLAFKVLDVQNISNIQVLASTKQYNNTTPHNPFVVSNNLCFMSSYQDGLQLYNISSPATPSLVGFFDTYYQGGGNNNNWSGDDYDGQWGCYPYFPSKNIFACDQKNGIFMLRTNLYRNPAANFNNPSVSCTGNTVSLASTSTFVSTFNWTLNGASPATSTLANPVVVYNQPGIYTISLIAGNTTTTTALVTKTIQITGASVALTTTNISCPTCSNAVAIANVSGGTAPYTYTWLPTGGNAATAISLAAGCYTVRVKDANNCTSSSSVCFSISTVGITEIENESITIYPNPVSSELYVNFNDAKLAASVTIFNQLGQIVKKINTTQLNKNDKGELVIPAQNLSKGVYYIQISQNNKVLINKQIIKQ